MMIEKPYKLATRVIILNNAGCCLLLRCSMISKRSSGKWEFPGGKIDAGEDIDVALRREVKEETGLTISPRRVVGTTEVEMENFKLAQIIFEANVDSSNVHLSPEHDNYAWVEVKKLLNIELADYLLSFVKDYIRKGKFYDSRQT